MPYKINKKGCLLPASLDRRIKLMDSDKEFIKWLHTEGESIRAIARLHKVSPRTIQFILFPERKKKNLADRKARGGSKQYYKGGKDWSETIKEHRHYKHNVLKEKPTKNA